MFSIDYLQKNELFQRIIIANLVGSTPVTSTYTEPPRSLEECPAGNLCKDDGSDPQMYCMNQNNQKRYCRCDPVRLKVSFLFHYIKFQTEKCRAFERQNSGADPVHDMAFQKGLLKINACDLFSNTLIQLAMENSAAKNSNAPIIKIFYLNFGDSGSNSKHKIILFSVKIIIVNIGTIFLDVESIKV